MNKPTKIPKEQAIYEKNLAKHYEATGYCPVCHIKLCIDRHCGNFFCEEGNK